MWVHGMHAGDTGLNVCTVLHAAHMPACAVQSSERGACLVSHSATCPDWVPHANTLLSKGHTHVARPSAACHAQSCVSAYIKQTLGPAQPCKVGQQRDTALHCFALKSHRHGLCQTGWRLTCKAGLAGTVKAGTNRESEHRWRVEALHVVYAAPIASACFACTCTSLSAAGARHGHQPLHANL